MKKFFKLFGIIATVAIIGFSFAALSLTGCGGGGGSPLIIPSDPLALNGTWEGNDGTVLTLLNGTFVETENNKQTMKGIYTASQRSIYADITFTVTEFHGDAWNEHLEDTLGITLQNIWYNKITFKNALKNEYYEYLIDQLIDIVFMTIKGTIDTNNKMFLEDGTTYTKKVISGGGIPLPPPGGGDGGIGGTFTLTGIPPQYNGKYARVTGVGGPVMITGFQSMTSTDIILPQITNGSVTIPLWVTVDLYSPSTWVRYSGSDTFMMLNVNFYNSGSDKVNQTQTELVNIPFLSVTFSNGNAAKSWNDALMVLPQ